MSKDKYPSLFSPQMEAIVFIILQIFYATRAVLKFNSYSQPIRFAKFDGKSVNRGLLVLDKARAIPAAGQKDCGSGDENGNRQS